MASTPVSQQSPYTSKIPAAQGYQGYQGQFAAGGGQPQQPAGGSPTPMPLKGMDDEPRRPQATGRSTPSAADLATTQPTSTSTNSIAGNTAIATAAAQVPAQYSLQDAQNNLTQWTQSTYGQALNPQQWQQLAGHIGYQGGNVTQQQLDAARQAIQQYAPQLGWTPSTPTPGGTPQSTPAGPGPLVAANGTNSRVNIDPMQTFTTQNAISIVQQHAQQWFGRQLNPQELDQVAQFVGFGGQGNVNGRTVNMALDLLQMWGNQGNGGTTPTSIPTFQDPTDPALNADYNAYLRRLLANPESMGPDVVAAMQARQREETLSYLRQAQEANAQRAASRGALSGGVTAGNERRLTDTAAAQMTAGNRDIEIEAAKTNFGDRLRTSSAVNEGIGGVHNRGLASYQAALQAALAKEGLALDKQKLAQSNWQFNQGYGLSYLQLLNDLIMGRANYGINLAQLGQQGQGNMFNWLQAATGGR